MGHPGRGAYSGESGEATSSGENIGLASATLPIGLRGFLSDISPGMFLLLIVFWNFKDALHPAEPGATYRAILYALVAVPSGFLANSIGYYSLGALVRCVESRLLCRDRVCSRLVTAMDWGEIRAFFGFGGDEHRTARQLLLFRYECEEYLKARRSGLYRPFGHLVGLEILSRTMVVLTALAWMLYVYSQLTADAAVTSASGRTLGIPAASAVALIAAATFLLLSALDSLYVGLRCIRDVFVICRYEQRQADGLAWSQRLMLLYRPEV